LFQAHSVAIPVHGTAVVKDIFYESVEIIEKYELPLNKILCLVINGSPAVTDSKSGGGVLGKLDEELGSKFLSFDCIIHPKLL
jgi:hypothetical protein